MNDEEFAAAQLELEYLFYSHKIDHAEFEFQCKLLLDLYNYGFPE